jgi:hypothetical protein
MTALLLTSASAYAVPLGYSGGVYTQNFNGLPTNVTNPSQVITGKGPHEFTAVTGASGLTGWQFGNLAGSSPDTEFRSQNGSLGGSAGRGTISYGLNADTDRALGLLPTSNQLATFGLVLKNEGASTLTSFTLNFVGEQWRRGNVTTPNKLSFEYQVGASAINSGGSWTAVPALNFVSPVMTGPTEVALNGNLAANQTPLGATVSGFNWLPGSTLVLRWTIDDLTGQDNGLAIDNLTFAVPEPSTFVLAAVGLVAASGLAWRRRNPRREARHVR